MSKPTGFLCCAPGSTSLSSTSPVGASSSADVAITLQPPLPPLTDTQRKQAAAVLRRSKQLHQQVKLHASTQLDLLVLHPLSLYQQYSQGVGVYAGRAAAACQTRQLDQDIREQDVQTDQVGRYLSKELNCKGLSLVMLCWLTLCHAQLFVGLNTALHVPRPLSYAQ